MPGTWKSSTLASFFGLVLAFGLGFHWRYQALDRSLWYDEIFSIQSFMSTSLLDSVSTYKAANNHLLNSFLSKLSADAFPGPAAYRWPSLAFGIAGIALVTAWAWRRGGHELAALATGLSATLPGHVSFSAECRGYSGASLACLGVLIGMSLESRSSRWLLFFSVLAALLFHPASLLVTLGAAGCWIGQAPWRVDSERWKAWLGGHALAFVIYLKVLKRLWSFARRNVAQSWDWEPLERASEVLRSWSSWEPFPLLGLLVVGLILLSLLDRRLAEDSRPREDRRWRQVVFASIATNFAFWLIPGTYHVPRFGLLLSLALVVVLAQGLLKIRRRAPVLAVMAWGLLIGAQARVANRWSRCELQANGPALLVARRWASEGGLETFSAGLGAGLLAPELPRSKRSGIVLEMYSGSGGEFEAPRRCWVGGGLRSQVRVFEIGPGPEASVESVK